MLFFIICSCSQTRSCSKTVVIKAMSQTRFLHKFSNSQPGKKSFYIFLFSCWSCCAHTSMTESPLPWDFPLPFLAFTVAEAATFTACALHSSQDTASGFEAQIVLFSMVYTASIKKMFFTCFRLVRKVGLCLISLPHTELPGTTPSLPFSVFSTHMTAIK